MVRFSAKKKAFLWVPISQLSWPSCSWTDSKPLLSLHIYPLISPYTRYVDDIYLQTTSEDMADQFHSTMNNLHPKLKFEIEKPEITPSGHSLSLLDFKVTISKDGKSSFEFYKKTAKKPICVLIYTYYNIQYAREFNLKSLKN